MEEGISKDSKKESPSPPPLTDEERVQELRDQFCSVFDETKTSDLEKKILELSLEGFYKTHLEKFLKDDNRKRALDLYVKTYKKQNTYAKKHDILCSLLTDYLVRLATLEEPLKEEQIQDISKLPFDIFVLICKRLSENELSAMALVNKKLAEFVRELRSRRHILTLKFLRNWMIRSALVGRPLVIALFRKSLLEKSKWKEFPSLFAVCKEPFYPDTFYAKKVPFAELSFGVELSMAQAFYQPANVINLDNSVSVLCRLNWIGPFSFDLESERSRYQPPEDASATFTHYTPSGGISKGPRGSSVKPANDLEPLFEDLSDAKKFSSLPINTGPRATMKWFEDNNASMKTYAYHSQTEIHSPFTYEKVPRSSYYECMRSLRKAVSHNIQLVLNEADLSKDENPEDPLIPLLISSQEVDVVAYMAQGPLFKEIRRDKPENGNIHPTRSLRMRTTPDEKTNKVVSIEMKKLYSDFYWSTIADFNLAERSLSGFVAITFDEEEGISPGLPFPSKNIDRIPGFAKKLAYMPIEELFRKETLLLDIASRSTVPDQKLFNRHLENNMGAWTQTRNLALRALSNKQNLLESFDFWLIMVRIYEITNFSKKSELGR